MWVWTDPIGIVCLAFDWHAGSEIFWACPSVPSIVVHPHAFMPYFSLWPSLGLTAPGSASLTWALRALPLSTILFVKHGIRTPIVGLRQISITDGVLCLVFDVDEQGGLEVL